MAATIQPGILGSDGILRGAIEDMVLFDMFYVEPRDENGFDTGKVSHRVIPIRDRETINREANTVADKHPTDKWYGNYIRLAMPYLGDELEDSDSE